jgi:hypothetical protein
LVEVTSTNAIANIFEYVAPIASVPQGNYEPIVQLVHCNFDCGCGSYMPSEKQN